MRKSAGLFVLFMVVFVTTAFAGILSDIGTVAKGVASSGSMWVGLAALVLVYIFKAIPNQKIYGIVDAISEKFGIAMTLGLSKWKWSAPLWNQYVEPWIIDLIQNTIGAAVNGWIRGMRSDNPPDA